MDSSKPTLSVPKGYIAASPYSQIVAVDSKSLSEHGEVHMPTGTKWADMPFITSKELRPLDAFVEMTIKGDPRLEGLKAKAKIYGQQYADPTSADYIANVQQREKRISTLIVNDIGATYGPYSHETGKGYNAAEISTVMPKNLRDVLEPVETVQLKDIKKDALVCRHFAPIASVLLHEAGIPNHLVMADVVSIKKSRNGKVEFDTNLKSDTGLNKVSKPAPHAFVITDQGNAIVEATVAGKTDKVTAYQPIANGVTVKDMIYSGKSAIPDLAVKGRDFIYGGHSGDGQAAATKSLWSIVKNAFSPFNTADIMRSSVEDYNHSLPNSFIPNPNLSQSAKGIGNTDTALAKLGIPKVNLGEFIVVPAPNSEEITTLVHMMRLPQPAKEQGSNKTLGGK